MAHSPATDDSSHNSSSRPESGGGSKVITLGDHVDHIVNKDYGPPMSSYRSYPR